MSVENSITAERRNRNKLYWKKTVYSSFKQFKLKNCKIGPVKSFKPKCGSTPNKLRFFAHLCAILSDLQKLYYCFYCDLFKQTALNNSVFF